MNNYEKYLDGKNYVQEISEKDCLAKRKEFYSCVKDKKNELTKEIKVKEYKDTDQEKLNRQIYVLYKILEKKTTKSKVTEI